MVAALERVGDDVPLRVVRALPAAECERDGEPTGLEGGADESRERWGVGGLGCRAGHRGPLCAKCEPGWAVGFDGLCEQCSDEVRTRSLITIAVGGGVLVIVAAVTLAFILPRTQKRLKERRKRDEQRQGSGRRAPAPPRGSPSPPLVVSVLGRLCATVC